MTSNLGVPLDKTNIAHFTELVREMSVQTQFILITHSKRTMSIAPVLYGMTMQEPGYRSWYRCGLERLNTEALLKNYEVFLIVIHRGPPPVSFPQDKAVVSKTRSYLNSGF
jgi:hypothetical protein